MKLKKFNFYFERFLYLAAGACFFVSLFSNNTKKIVTPVSIVFVLTAIHMVLKKTEVNISNELITSFYFFIVVAMFLADEFNFYSIIPYLDKVEHLSSGVILCFLGHTIFEHTNRNETNVSYNKLTVVLFSAFFAIAMAGCWEIFEFTVDHLFGMNTQLNSLWDTMTDIICGTTGATLTAIYLYNTLASKSISYKHEDGAGIINC